MQLAANIVGHYDATTGRWMCIDPLAEKYCDVSPYAYCKNNPVKYVDPDGKDSYYSNNGNFIFNTNTKTDNIYIINSYKRIRQNKNSKIYEIKGKTLLGDSKLSAKAYSEIFTTELKRKGFDTSKLINGAISVNVLSYNTSSNLPLYYVENQHNVHGKGSLSFSIYERGPAIGTTNKINGAIQVVVNVYPSGSEEREYVSTESNIKSLLGIHEFQSHAIDGLHNSDHAEILHRQKADSSWESTTSSFKSMYEEHEKNLPEYQSH